MDTVETDQYAAALKRMIRAAGRRVANGEIDELPLLVGLREDIAAAEAQAVAGLRGEPNLYSWRQIADVLGISRQAAMQRWPETPGRQAGGQPSHLR